MTDTVEVMARAICDHAELGKYNRVLAQSLNDVQAMGKLRKIRYQAQAAQAALTANGLAVVKVEPTNEQRRVANDLVSIFVADDDHLRFVTEDLVVRSYRAMCRT